MRWTASRVAGHDCAHVRLHLPDGVMRLDLVGGADFAEVAAIEPVIDLARALEPQFTSVRRLAILMQGAHAHIHDQRVVRLVEALRAADALAAGASLRDIGLGAFGDDWPGDGEHLKSKVRRRIALAAVLARSGPSGVLTGRI